MPKAPAQTRPAAATDAAADPTDPWTDPPNPTPANGPDAEPAVPLQDQLSGLAEDTDYLSVCYYGLEGSGKTTAVAAMAHLGNILLINAESGAKPRALRDRGIPVENIRVWPDQARGEAFDYDGLEGLYHRLKSDLMRDPNSWVGVGADSITELVRMFINNERTVQYRRAVRRNKERDRWFTDRDDWNTVTTQVGELLRKFRYLPCHFAMSGLQRRDDSSGLFGPSANPGVASDLPGFVDMLIHCDVQELRDDGPDVFIGWSRTHDKYRAKDRYGVLPKALPDPHFHRLLSYVRGGLTPETDELLLDIRARRAKLAHAAAEAATAADPK